MAWGFETYSHAKSMAQLITFSVGCPAIYILLKFKNSISVHLNKTPTGPDIWKCHHTDSNNIRASGHPAKLFAAATLGIRQTVLFPSDSLRVKQQGLAIFYHLIILKSSGCHSSPPRWGRCHWFQATNFCPFRSGQKRRLETHHAILPIPIP